MKAVLKCIVGLNGLIVLVCSHGCAGAEGTKRKVDYDDSAQHALLQDTRVEALRTLNSIELINKGDVEGLCELMEMQLQGYEVLMKPHGVNGTSQEDERKNARVYLKMREYMDGSTRCISKARMRH
jgi:hypothetical protein